MGIFFLAVMLSIGTAVAQDHKSGSQSRPSAADRSKQNPDVSGGSSGQKASKIPPPEEGMDFYNSWISPGARFVWIKEGTFRMGSLKNESGTTAAEFPSHMVTLTQGFWLLDHEVTQQEYKWVMGGGNPSKDKRNGLLPVECISWDDAVAFCRELTRMERGLGRIRPDQEYRLPTEAEWEYACRAGTTGQRYGELDAIAWYKWNSEEKTQLVRQKVPNAWGLYDMIGNVWEWCSDGWGDYSKGPETDPKGPKSGSGTSRVTRGGSIVNSDSDGQGLDRIRANYRANRKPTDKIYTQGFRPALSKVR